MKVSVITVSFNSVDTIGDTLEAVRSQAGASVEHIVVDGGSTDGTQAVVGRCNEQVTKFISEPDEGIYDAMNKGIGLATGEVVGCLNADDVYADKIVLSDVAEAIEAQALDAVYGDLLYVGQEGNDRILRYWRAGEYRPGSFRSGWVPPHPTFFCRRELFEKFGYYRSGYRIAGDFELMFRFIEKHRINVRYIPKPLVHMRVGGRANTMRGIMQGNREIVHAFRCNGAPFPMRFFPARLARRVWQLARRPSPNLVP